MKKLLLQDKLCTCLQRYPDHIAIECGERKLSYRELDRRSAAISQWILSSGIKKGSLIGIYMEDTVDFIIVMTGILRAGCVFVPLDKAYPLKQIETMLHRSGTRIVFCDGYVQGSLSRMGTKMGPPLRVIPVDGLFYPGKEPSPPVECIAGYDGEDMVYIDFKSGPGNALTAVAGKNKSLAHLVEWEIETLVIGPTFRVGQLASPGTGTFLLEVLPALCSGAAVCIHGGPSAALKKVQDTGVVFMFAGLGSQYINMGLDLYREEPRFREEMDRCFEILQPLTGYDIKEILYPSSGFNRSDRFYSKKINQIEIAQLVIFIFEYALARLLMKWGIRPRALLGYSFGEYTTACLSGVFSLEDALKLIAARGRLLAQLPAGAMTSVPLERERLEPLLEEIAPGLSIAIDNGPSCIAAGPEAAVLRFEKELKKRKLLTMPLKATRAIHSTMVEPMLAEFAESVRRVTRHKPRIPYISNVTGSWITETEATDPHYWVKQLRETVRFAEGLNTVLEGPPSVFVEIGPGADLSALMRYHTNDNPGHKIINTVKNPGKDIPDMDFLLDSTAHLRRWGVSMDRSAAGGELTRWMDVNHIGLLVCSPHVFHLINTASLTAANFRSLTHVLLYGGDILPRRLGNWYRTFGPRIHLVSLYGAAETTMVKAFYKLQPADVHREAVPVGQPVRGARIIVLNKNMNICDRGMVGEIYIRTPYRALGYCNNPGLTSERFIPNPFNLTNDPNDLIYKTGDAGKVLADGTIRLLAGTDGREKLVENETRDYGDYEAPRNEIEEKLAVLWCQILKREKVGIADDFFELGGHSLGIMMLAAEIYKTFKVEMTVPQLFNMPRIKEIAAFIMETAAPGAAVSHGEEPYVVFNEQQPVKLFLFPPRIAYGLDYKGLAGLLPGYCFYAFNYLEQGGVHEYAALIKKIQPKGPYVLLGYSAGGNLAFEVAKEMEANGATVSHLILLDAYSSREAAGMAGAEMQEKYLDYIETNMITMGLSFLKEQVIGKIEKYACFLDGLEHRGIVEAVLHLITGVDRKVKGDWDRFTAGGCVTYEGYGKHIEMLAPGFLEKNVEIIRTILIRSFSGVQGAVFQKSPLVAEGNLGGFGEQKR